MNATETPTEWVVMPHGKGITSKQALLHDLNKIAPDIQRYQLTSYSQTANAQNSHTHCDICWEMISALEDDDVAYFDEHSPTYALCTSCYDSFFKNTDFRQVVENLERAEAPKIAKSLSDNQIRLLWLIAMCVLAVIIVFAGQAFGIR